MVILFIILIEEDTIPRHSRTASEQVGARLIVLTYVDVIILPNPTSTQAGEDTDQGSIVVQARFGHLKVFTVVSEVISSIGPSNESSQQEIGVLSWQFVPLRIALSAFHW